MNYPVVVAVVVSVLALGACERPSRISERAPAGVMMVPVPGPAGPAGEEGRVGMTGPSGMVGTPGMTGSPGMMGVEGAKGEQGQASGETTVVVVPAK